MSDAPARPESERWARRLGAWIAPLAAAALAFLALRPPIVAWLRGADLYDEEAIREWIREARVESANLPELVRVYLDLADRETALAEANEPGDDLFRVRQRIEIKREEIAEFLKTLGNPPTRQYRGQLPLFPVVYRLSVHFSAERKLAPIVWDSELPREASQFRLLKAEPIDADAERGQGFVDVAYSLHAFHQVQTQERREATRRLLVGGLSLCLGLAATSWYFYLQRRRRLQERQTLLAEQQAGEAERRRLEAELLRQEAERRHEEAERQNLELKSSLFANIGIMAGSYAHNIKNLLVRPNDLLRRCIDEQPSGDTQAQMLREVKETLATVTERLQQILHTVRRDPSRAERTRLDLNAVVRDMERTWGELARDKWKMNLTLDLVDGPLLIEGDLSHLQQALENLVFNARDATFEMRNTLREAARREALTDAERREALLAATAWRGQVSLRTRRDPNGAVLLEVSDNGIGMTDEVRRSCTQTHFSTKRNNALFAGLSAGMGLGLSFVTVILAHHRASLDIESAPRQGATFRVRFPAVAP